MALGRAGIYSIRRDFTINLRKKEILVQLQLECDAIDIRDEQILGMIIKENEIQTENKICTNCNIAYDESIKFCVHCGRKL